MSILSFVTVVFLMRIALAASITAAWSLGVFDKKGIIGPPRLEPGESPRLLLGAIGFALAFFAACPLLFQIIHEFVQRHHHQTPTTRLSEPETVVFSGIMEVMVLVGILAGTLMSRPNGLRWMGLSTRRIPDGIFTGLGAIAIAMPLIFVVNDLTESTLEHYGKTPPPHQLLEILKTNPPLWLRATDVLCAGLIAPIAEEMFFRGLVQTAIRYMLNRPWAGVICAAAFFALVHPWYTWPQIFVLGVCLGYTYERTGNLWASITMHASFNLLSIYLFTHFS